MYKYIVVDSKTLRSVATKTLKEAKKLCKEFNKDRLPEDKDSESPACIYPIDSFLSMVMKQYDLLEIENLNNLADPITV